MSIYASQQKLQKVSSLYDEEIEDSLGTGLNESKTGDNDAKIPSLIRSVSLQLDEINVPMPRFASALMITDPEKLHNVVEHIKSQFMLDDNDYTSFVRLLIKEHFKMNTDQFSRDLSEADIDTLMWIKGLYEGKEASSRYNRQQKLPYAKKPVNFWSHIRQIETVIASMSEIWAFDSPQIIRGFLSYDDTHACIAERANPFVFFFRLSNSDPRKLILARNAFKDISDADGTVEKKICSAQTKRPHFTSLDDFVTFIQNNESKLQYVYSPTPDDDDDDDTCHISTVLQRIQDSRWKQSIENQYNAFKTGYTDVCIEKL